MATIKIIGGDYPKGTVDYFFGQLCVSAKETISAKDLQNLQPISGEQVKSITGTLGWGAVGGMALGPVGLAAGLLAGGNKKEVTFIVENKVNGKKIIARASNKTYTKMFADIHSTRTPRIISTPPPIAKKHDVEADKPRTENKQPEVKPDFKNMKMKDPDVKAAARARKSKRQAETDKAVLFGGAVLLGVAILSLAMCSA